MLPKPTISSLVAATPFAIELKDTQDNAKTKAGDSLVVFRIDDLLHPVLHHGESYLVDVMLAASVLRSTPAYLIGHRKAVALAFAHSPDRQANTSKPFHFCHALASPKHHLDARIWAEKVLELMSLRCVAGYYVGYIVPVDWKTICELRPPTSTGPTEAPTKLHLLLDREDTLPREKQVSATGPNKATASRSSKSSSSINKGKKAVKPTKSKAAIMAAYAREAEYLIHSIRHKVPLSEAARKEALKRYDEAKTAISMEMDEEVEEVEEVQEE